jgi:hypothetical protein
MTKLIEKYKELLEQYKLFHDSVISPGVVKVIYDTWMNYNEQLESEIAELEKQSEEQEEINPYLLTGDELKRTEDKAKQQ